MGILLSFCVSAPPSKAPMGPAAGARPAHPPSAHPRSAGSPHCALPQPPPPQGRARKLAYWSLCLAAAACGSHAGPSPHFGSPPVPQVLGVAVDKTGPCPTDPLFLSGLEDR